MGQDVHEEAIQSDSDYQLAVRLLDQRRRPARILRLVMNALEAYRQARKMGWSRPQNKQGLTVFQSFRLDPEQDRALVDSVFQVAQNEFPELSPADRGFLSELQQDPKLMAFIFVHDLEEQERGRRFEGITFSLGRRAACNPRFRDRFDLILDAEVVEGRSQGLSRVRAYVDPFRQPVRSYPGRALVHEAVDSAACERLFERAGRLHAEWQHDDERQWAHWTTEYIDYFGPRREAITDTQFPTAIDVIAARRSA